MLSYIALCHDVENLLFKVILKGAKEQYYACRWRNYYLAVTHCSGCQNRFDTLILLMVMMMMIRGKEFHFSQQKKISPSSEGSGRCWGSGGRRRDESVSSSQERILPVRGFCLQICCKCSFSRVLHTDQTLALCRCWDPFRSWQKLLNYYIFFFLLNWQWRGVWLQSVNTCLR